MNTIRAGGRDVYEHPQGGWVALTEPRKAVNALDENDTITLRRHLRIYFYDGKALSEDGHFYPELDHYAGEA